MWAFRARRRAGPPARVRIHPAACPELSGVQRRGCLELHVHFAVGLPPLLTDVVLQMFGESAHRELVILRGDLLIRLSFTVHELPEIGLVDGDDITVRSQQVSPAQILDLVAGLTLQCGLDLLGSDTAAEGAREDVADGALEAALETGNKPHRPSFRVVSFLTCQ